MLYKMTFVDSQGYIRFLLGSEINFMRSLCIFLVCLVFLFLSSPEDMGCFFFFCFFGGERERKGKREKNIRLKGKYRLAAPQLGIEPAIHVCALTRNWTRNPLVYGTTLEPAEPPSQAHFVFWSPICYLLNTTWDLSYIAIQEKYFRFLTKHFCPLFYLQIFNRKLKM